jgi:predicted secreted protein
LKLSQSKLKATALVILLILGTSNSQAATTKTISEAENGKTISVKSGTALTIELQSTFWDGTKTKNLVQVKPSEIIPITPSPTAAVGCQHPGSGCGTIKWFYKVKKKGLATFSATRTSCGEVLQCTPENSNYKVKFLVK